MQENNFEKGVRQKMDELSFEPSAPVWQKVELQIQQKRRRRRLVFLLLPLLLTSGIITWYFTIDTGNKKVAAVAQENKMESTHLSSEKAKSKTEENIATLKTESSISSKTQKENETFLAAQQKKRMSIQKQKETFVAATKNKIKKGVSTKPEEETDFFESDLHALILQNEIDKKEGKKPESEAVTNPFQKKKENEWQKKLADLTLAENEKSRSRTTDDSAQKTEVAIKSEVADSATFTPIKKSKGKSDVWQWSLNARVGVSGLGSNVVDLFNHESRADFSAAPSTGNNGPQQPRIANVMKNNLAFSIGGSVRRRMSSSAFISLGLQYSYYSSQSKVGTNVNADTTVFYNGRPESLSNYYTNTGNASNYINRYHYVEVPLAIDYTLFKKLPLQLQHGISVGYLLGTNALVQNPTSGIYFRSENWSRKTSFNLFTSLDYRLINKPSFSLLAGPQLQWALTPVQQAGAPKKQHLFFAGLHTQLRF